MSEYDDRYQPGYKRICAIAHRATKGTCCVCMRRKSEEIHHAFYRKEGDIPGFNVFACCLSCHDSVCHSSKNWIRDKVDPVWKNCNTESFTQRLRFGYEILNKGIKY